MGGRILLGVVPAVVLVIAGCGSAPASSGGGVGEPPLVGTAWQLASYQDSATADPVRVKTDSTIAFSANGRFGAHACNYIGGPARIDGHTITFRIAGSTAMACGGESATLEQAVEATVTGSVDWSIRAGTLTLTNRNGHVLTYRVRPSIYPSLTARTIVAGTRAGGQFRLAVDRQGAHHLYLIFEERAAPGDAWGSAAQSSPGPGDCLASTVLPAGQLGDETFLAAWATPEVAKITTRRTDGAPETPLAFYRVPGSTLRIAGLWTTGFQPGKSPVTFHDRTGAVIAAYPNGPC